ncbi:hypothetical protein MNV84_03847 [Leishmania braziliensis]|nr:hypothetical protein MNV84_03847 [Leishmania braziliensis]
MSQLLSTYSLLQCVVSAAQFASGEISFYDTYAELTAADADGSRTSPLRVEYDVLEHFRIVRAQGVMRLTLPRGVVRQWAAQNSFETQLDEYEGEQTNVHGGNRSKAGAFSIQMTDTKSVLLVQLSLEDMAAFLNSIAPLIAASRRTRSMSRISVTEPLPVYGVPLVDPAASMPTDAATSSRAMSTASANSQEEAAESNWASGKNNAAPVCDRRHYRPQRQRRGERDTAHCTPSRTDDNAGQKEGCRFAKHSDERRTTVAANNAAPRATDTAPELLGGDSGGSSIGATESETHGDAAQPLSGSPAASTGCEEDEGGTTRRTVRVADALAVTATAGATAQVDRRPSSPKHRQLQQATPSRFVNTLESVAEELAELMEEADQPEHYRGCRGEPLHRRQPTAAAVVTAVQRAGQQQASRCTQRRPLPIVALTAAPSVCPSLKSTISETHVLRHPHRQQSPSASEAQAQCGVNGVHSAAAADSGTAVTNRRSAQWPMGMTTPMQGRCLARTFVRSGGGAHLCASELSSASTAELPPFATHGGCDGRAAPQEGHAMPSPASEERPVCIDKASTVAGAALCNVNGVRRAADGWTGSETQWAALRTGTVAHAFADTKDGCRDDACAAPVATPIRSSSRPSSVASSVKLGDMLALPGASREPGGPAKGVIASWQRIAQFRSGGAGAAPVKQSPPCAGSSSSAADVAAYLRELFPVEDTVPKATRKRCKAQTVTTAGAVGRLSVSQRRRHAPARRAVDLTASATGAVTRALVSTDISSRTADGATASQLPLKAVPSPPLAKMSSNISAAIATHAIANRRRRSLTAGAVGTTKRVKVDAAAAVPPLDSSIDAARDKEKDTEATTGSSATGHCAAACLTQPPQPKVCSAVSVPQRVAISVRDAGALGLVQAPLPLCGAAWDKKPGVAVAAREEAAAAAAAALNDDAAKVVEGLIRGPSAEADSRKAPRDGVRHRRTQLLRAKLLVQEAAPPAGCADDPSRYHTEAAAAGHHGKTGDRASISSSQATCPLLYCRESRKERSRRVLRYMNLISQSIAAVHETHDALRGLLLLMMEEDQL